ncbi:MAG: non-canonical purine NTP pyrophosphatase, RdgB/HAM1 family [Phycisphaerae bacterium]|nr:non-canonical purine NTP pyrophosphatase, RdgB/HAM1 family [Phycisphaerae bacterium]
MNILFATSNPHKVEEVVAILAPEGIKVRSLADVGDLPPEPVEDADTFAGNARIKARAYAKATGERCLADDSGLEVDALNGEPGVHSARYAGAQGDRAARDAANNAKLLEAIARVPDADRAARFVCAMCLADPDGTIVAETRGTFEGLITTDYRGTNGFGYDPLLFIPDQQCTSAELSPEMKNARSHRGQAVRLLVSSIASLDQ